MTQTNLDALHDAAEHSIYDHINWRNTRKAIHQHLIDIAYCEGRLAQPAYADEKARLMHLLWRVTGNRIRRTDADKYNANVLHAFLDDALKEYYMHWKVPTKK